MQLIRRRKFNFYSAKTLQRIQKNQYLSFDGVNDYGQVQKGAFNTLSEANYITLAIWVNFDQLQTYHSTEKTYYGALIGQSYLGGFSNGYGIHIMNDGFSVQVRYNSGAIVSVGDPTNYRDGKWHRVVATINLVNGVLNLYVDSVLKGTSNFTLSGSGNTNVLDLFRIGLTNQNRFYYKGRLDDIQVWERIWTDSEVSDDYTGIVANRTGLKLHYKIDETSGTSLKDSSVSNNSCTLYNGVSFESVYPDYKRTSYASFDGVNDYIRLPVNGTAINSFTVEGWFYLKSGFSSGGILSWGKTLKETGPRLYIVKDNDSTLRTYTNSAYSTTYTYKVNNWNHIAVSYNGVSTWLTYIDGVLVNTLTKTDGFKNNAQTLFIGEGYNGFVNGSLDDIKVWDIALTVEEIKASMYNSYTDPQPNLIAYYKLDGNAVDSSGNKYHGTAYNGVSYT